MSEHFSQAPINQLLNWILKEYNEKKEIFGIQEELFFKPSKNDKFTSVRYGELLETPIGVAAGPHTQMAQNIIAAYICGARYIELKTVQTLDKIHVSKPCIDMEDEGYNCEWSQELTLVQSYEEYLKAWIIIHVLKHKLGFENKTNQLGTIFNMSVGYSYDGIHNENVQTFLKNMTDCSKLKKEYINLIKDIYPEVVNLNIPDMISNSVTLSTMHGCPPAEIEKIATYLLKERKFHTTVKLNPTLLGKTELRNLLNNKLGFDTITVPDIAFEHDIVYDAASSMLKKLIQTAKESKVDFSIKLTNTLETVNNKDIFSKDEKMMYMSGRALHPISVNVAAKLQNEFDGNLDISFSAGADAFNVCDILTNNIKPITVCSDILKPGGYTRLKQYTDNIKAFFDKNKFESIEEVVLKTANEKKLNKAIVKNLNSYAKSVVLNKRYHKEEFPYYSIKTDVKLGKFDCVNAPCITTCPTHQEIPNYIYLTAKKDFEAALRVIKDTNPFPNSTGMACDHKCQEKCTRINYDKPILIRDIKRFIALKEKNIEKLANKPVNNTKVAIIGGGPSGLSCAYFLATEGYQVTVYESKSSVGGMITHALPNFRADSRVSFDIERIKSLGVQIVENAKINKKEFEELKAKFDYIYISVGASKGKNLDVDGENAEGVLDFLSFLDDVKYNHIKKLNGKVLVIGGGNSAIDAARSALRLGGDVKLVYRRTQKEMPADLEELHDLLKEGIEIIELTAPNKVVTEKGKVKGLECYKMKLTEPDSSGRRKPVKVEGSEFVIDCSYIIKAIGQDTVLDFIDGHNVELLKNGTIKVNSNHQTNIPNIFAGGDVSRGPASIIKAIADGKEVAFNIIGSVKEKLKTKKDISLRNLKIKKATRVYRNDLNELEADKRNNFNMVIKPLTDNEAAEESNRCLYCDEVCDICVTVCPNRANVSYSVKPEIFKLKDIIVKNSEINYSPEYKYEISQQPQVLNIGDFCNECGNCTMFCPSSGRPFADKPKVYLTKESYSHENTNALYFENNTLFIKMDGDQCTIKLNKGDYLVEGPKIIIELNESLTIKKVILKELVENMTINMKNITGFVTLFNSLKTELNYLFK